MTTRFVWLAAPVVLGAVLCFSLSATAQKPAAPDVGQQGEFNGEHVDTGAAALDTGPEAAEPAEGAEAAASIKTPAAPARVAVSKTAAARTSAPSVANSSSGHDLDVEGNFDLQEIAGVDVAEVH